MTSTPRHSCSQPRQLHESYRGRLRACFRVAKSLCDFFLAFKGFEVKRNNVRDHRVGIVGTSEFTTLRPRESRLCVHHDVMLRPAAANRPARTCEFDQARWPAKSYQIQHANRKAIFRRVPTYQCKPHFDSRLAGLIFVTYGHKPSFCRIHVVVDH